MLEELKVQIALGSIPYLEKIGLAQNSKTPGSILEQLSRDSSQTVKYHVALNHNAYISVLEHLSRDENWAIRANVAANPYAPMWLLKQLSKDEHETTRYHAKKSFNEKLFRLVRWNMEKEITKAARAVAMEYVDIPGKDLEFVTRQITNIIIRETKLVALLIALKKAKDFYERDFECSGGCDHSVGICECADRKDYEDLCTLLNMEMKTFKI